MPVLFGTTRVARTSCTVSKAGEIGSSHPCLTLFRPPCSSVQCIGGVAYQLCIRRYLSGYHCQLVDPHYCDPHEDAAVASEKVVQLRCWPGVAGGCQVGCKSCRYTTKTTWLDVDEGGWWMSVPSNMSVAEAWTSNASLCMLCKCE